MEKLSLQKMARFIFKNIIVVLLLTIGGAWLAREYTNRYVTKRYSSSVQIITPLDAKSAVDGNTTNEIDKNVRLITTYADIVRSTAVLEKVSKQIENKTTRKYTVSDLSEVVSVNNNTDSQVFSVKAVASNPQDAALIANTTFTVLKENIEDLLGVTNIQAISNGVANPVPDSPNMIIVVLVGALVGFMLALGALVVIDQFKRSHKEYPSIEDKKGLKLRKVSMIPLRKMHHVRRELVRLSVKDGTKIRKKETAAS